MDLPRALRANNNVRVVFDIQHAGLRPSVITIRPIQQPGVNVDDLRTFNFLANGLRLRIIRELNTALGWNQIQIRNQIRGSLIMANRLNPDHTATLNNIRVGDINAGILLQAFEVATANGSNPDLSLSDVEWRYWINPATFQVGGSKVSFSASFHSFRNSLYHRSLCSLDRISQTPKSTMGSNDGILNSGNSNTVTSL